MSINNDLVDMNPLTVCEEQEEMDRHLNITYVDAVEDMVMLPKKTIVDDLTLVYSVVEVDVSHGRPPHVISSAVYEDTSFLVALKGHFPLTYDPRELDIMADFMSNSFNDLNMLDTSSPMMMPLSMGSMPSMDCPPEGFSISPEML